jgi:hypothetical protein
VGEVGPFSAPAPRLRDNRGRGGGVDGAPVALPAYAASVSASQRHSDSIQTTQGLTPVRQCVPCKAGKGMAES